MALCIEKPSKHMEDVWIYAERTRQNCIRYGDPDPDKVGKWMLFLDRKVENEDGFTKIDLCWLPIVQLVARGRLYGAKCSTALLDECYADQEEGVICCYTPNYNNKEGVKLAADSIREVVDYPKNMLYKTDNATREGIYRRHGNTAIALYSHAPDGKFYERDENNFWRLVRF